MYMKIGIIIVGLAIIIGGIWILQQPAPAADVPVPAANVDEDTAIDAEVTFEASEEEDEDDTGEVREFTIDAFNFGYSMEEIRVNQGDTVVITLTNSDGFHDWVLDQFDASTAQIQEGETTSVSFVADAAGTYEYYCSVGNHRAQGMVGNLIVE